MNGKGCAINECTERFGKYYRFPNPKVYPDIFQRWIEQTGREELWHYDQMRIYNNLRVWGKHFPDEHFGFNKRLLKGAVATLHLPVGETSAIDTEDVSLTNREYDYRTATSTNTLLRETTTLETEDLFSTNREDDYGTATSTNILNGSCKAIMATEDLSSTNVEESYLTATLTNILNETTPKSKEFENVATTSTNRGTLKRTGRKREYLLESVQVSKTDELTPKAKYLYNKAVDYKRKFHLQPQRCLKNKRKVIPKRLVFDQALLSFDRVRSFFLSQYDNEGKWVRGRRYTTDDKILGLHLMLQNGKGYKMLGNIFTLPYKRTILRMLKNVPIRPGLHTSVLNVIATTVKYFQNEKDKYCILLFDEMSMQSHLQYDTTEDIVYSFEDCGLDRSEKIANHVQVFMLRGIASKWK